MPTKSSTWSTPLSGMKSCSPSTRAVGAGTVCWAMGLSSCVRTGVTRMIPLSSDVLNADSLRESGIVRPHGRHRPADRCAAARERASLVPGHRRPGRAERAGGQAAGRPARGRRRHPRLRGGLDPGAMGWPTHAVVALYCEGRMAAAEVRDAVAAAPGGVGRVHRRGRGERDPPRARARHGRTSSRRSSASATRRGSSARRPRSCSRRCSTGRSPAEGAGSRRTSRRARAGLGDEERDQALALGDDRLGRAPGRRVGRLARRSGRS